MVFTSLIKKRKKKKPCQNHVCPRQQHRWLRAGCFIHPLGTNHNKITTAHLLYSSITYPCLAHQHHLVKQKDMSETERTQTMRLGSHPVHSTPHPSNTYVGQHVEWSPKWKVEQTITALVAVCLHKKRRKKNTNHALRFTHST